MQVSRDVIAAFERKYPLYAGVSAEMENDGLIQIVENGEMQCHKKGITATV